MSRWEKFLSDQAEVPMSLELKKGDVLPTQPPYPKIDIEESKQVPVTNLCYHVVQAKVTDVNGRGSEKMVVGRLVGILEGGGEVEFEREAHPASIATGTVDVSKCRACGGSIPNGAAVVLCGKLLPGGVCEEMGKVCKHADDMSFDDCDISGNFVAYHDGCLA